MTSVLSALEFHWIKKKKSLKWENMYKTQREGGVVNSADIYVGWLVVLGLNATLTA